MARKLTAQVSGGTVARYAQNVQIEAGGKGVAMDSSFQSFIHQTKCGLLDLESFAPEIVHTLLWLVKM